MNLMHLKYAVEVSETGSINKAAERLFVSQPNLSRAIKELEASLGVAIFARSARGMELTPNGEVFIRYAKNILKQINAVENLFEKENAEKQRFSVSGPRASYIAKAFSRFVAGLAPNEQPELFYRETNAMRVIKNLLQEDCELGILRYAENYDKYYKATLEEKGLCYELITDFSYLLLFSRQSPLAKLKSITYRDLQGLTQIAHADPYVPSLPFSEVKKDELPTNPGRCIYVYERASQFELLAENKNCFTWVSPVPKDLLSRYNLIQQPCCEAGRVYKDILVRRKNYTPTPLDDRFLEQLILSKREVFDL